MLCARVRVRGYVRACACACVCVYVCFCVRVFVCVYVRVIERQGVHFMNTLTQTHTHTSAPTHEFAHTMANNSQKQKVSDPFFIKIKAKLATGQPGTLFGIYIYVDSLCV